MIDAVEEFLDVQINHPVLLPAAPPARPHRIQRGPLRPITIGVGVEFWFHSFLQLHGYHRLRDSVRDGRHAEDPHPAMRFRYLHRQHRGREVTPRGHPIPYLVEIIPQIRLEVFDRAPVHSRRSLVGFDSLVCLPHEPLRNTEGLLLPLRLAHSIPPRILWLPERTSPGQSSSFAPPPLQELRHYYELVRMPAPRQYSAPRRFRPLERAPSRRPAGGGIGASLPTFHVKAADRARVAYLPGTAWPVTGSPPDSSWSLVLAPVLMPPKTNFDTSTAIRLRSPSRSPPDASCAPFPTRSRQRSSANAAVGGLTPLPEERRRRATTFIFHAAAQSIEVSYLHNDLSLLRAWHTHDLGLGRVQFQADPTHPLPQGPQHLMRLSL